MSDAGDDETNPNSPIKIENSPMPKDYFSPCNDMNAQRSAKARRDFIIRQRIITLRRRNEDIQLKVRVSKLDRQSEAETAREEIAFQQATASQRRLLHLETVRLKARILGSHPSISFQNSFLRPPSEYQKLSVDKTKAVYKRENSSRKFSQHSCNYTLYIHEVGIIQRAFRRKLLLDCAARVKNSNIIYNVLNGNYTYLQGLELVSSSQLDQIILLFDRIFLPTLKTSKYSLAFHAVLLLSNFDEYLKGNFLYELGPETIEHLNTGYYSTQTAFSSQFLIILRHVSLRLFHAIQCLLEAPKLVLLSPISVCRLRVARYWRSFQFFLVCLKRFNLLQLRDMSINLYNPWGLLQMQDENIEISKRRKYYDCVLALEWPKSQFKGIGENKEWIRTNTDLKTLSQAIFRAGSMIATFQLGAGSYFLDYDTHSFVVDHHFHKFVIVEKGNNYFTVPPDISISKWRKFWFLKFKQRNNTGSGYDGPKVMRTGTTKNNFFDEVTFSWNEVLELRDDSTDMALALSGGSWTDDLNTIDSMLTTLFYHYCDYCLQIGEDSETTACIVNLKELQSAYLVKKLGSHNPNMAAVYFRLFLILLAQVTLLAGADSSKIEEVLRAENMDYQEFSIQLYNLHHDCETQLYVKWFYYCKPNSFHEFVISENIYQLVLECCYKQSLGSGTPQLRFPEFYRFLLLNPSYKLTDRIDPFLIVTSSLWGPLFDSEVPQYKVKQYYLSTLMVFVLKDMCRPVQEKWTMHRIDQIGFFSYFTSELWEVCRSARSLVWASVISSMLQLTRHQAQIVFNHFDKDSSLAVLSAQMKAVGATEFQLKYLTHALTSKSEEEVISLFGYKLLDAFHESSTCEAVITKNHPYFTGRMIQLRKQIVEVSTSLYNLYFPLLNWIHLDLGSPQLKRGALE